jgi:hypothetical protein
MHMRAPPIKIPTCKKYHISSYAYHFTAAGVGRGGWFFPILNQEVKYMLYLIAMSLEC